MSDLVERLRELGDDYERWAAEIRSSGRPSVDADHREVTALALREAASRIEALEKAAAPFESEAQFALYCSPDDLDDDHELQLGPITVTIGDLRALARAAGGGE